MGRFWERVTTLDRRVIFLLVLAALVIGVLRPTEPEVRPATRQAFEAIDRLPAGSLVFLGVSLDTGSEPLVEQARVLLVHLLLRGARVLVAVPADAPQGALRAVLQDLDARAARLGDKIYGLDYAVVILQARDTGAETLLPLADRLEAGLGPADATGQPLESLRLLTEFRSLRRARLLVGLTNEVEGGAGRPGVNDYILAGRMAGYVPVVGGISATRSAALDRLLEAGDLAGALLGARGAAEYDTLLGGRGARGTGISRLWGGTSMLALLILFIVVVTTIADRMRDRDRSRRRGSPWRPGAGPRRTGAEGASPRRPEPWPPGGDGV